MPLKRSMKWMILCLAGLICFGLAGLAGAETGDRETITVAAVGDVMMGTENLLPADGGAGLFAACREFIAAADVAFFNHEGTLTDRGKPTKVSKEGWTYCFRTPPSYGRFLKEAGFDLASIANNHVNDYGEEGREDTIRTLAAQGIVWSGPPGTVARRDVKGVKVAMAAFHTSAHSHWVNDIPEAKRIVAGLARDNDVVIVSFHGGAEGAGAERTPRSMEMFHGEERGEVVNFSRAVVEAGADLVIGHGPHVPRAMEIYKDRLIAYSLGNFCTGKGISVKGNAGLAPLLLAELDAEGRLLGGRVVSFSQGFGEHPRLDGRNRAAQLIHQLGRQDFPETNAVAADGTIKPRF